MLSADFKPRLIPGTLWLFISRARIIPNLDGIFQITILNTTETDIAINAHKIIGLIHPMDKSIARVDRSECESTPNELNTHLNNIHLGENLAGQQKETM